MEHIVDGTNITLGACYYPEQWKKELWAEDLDRMLKAGIKVIRIAEFAWNKFEPHEGVFDYSFFDEFMELAWKKGMKVIFCTPTAAPPAWMSTNYPEILNTDAEGHPYLHGFRRHYSFNSPKFLEFTERIVTVIAEHYGSHPAIVGWQLDNEFNCEIKEYYSENDSIAFRKFLQDKYGDLDTLNEAWACNFWNQTYTDWAEVELPKRTVNDVMNPHRKQDYHHFISDSICKYAKLQADILRKYIKEGDFITHNGLFDNLDYHQMTEDALDFISYDSYPNIAYTLNLYDEKDILKDRKWSKNLTEVRSVSPIFAIMEQQSGTCGSISWAKAGDTRPGQLALWTLQSIAHGADFVCYFRWRTSILANEIYWHGILDYSGRDNRRLQEVTDLSKKLENLQEIAGATCKKMVGIVKDYDNIWDMDADGWHETVEKKSNKDLYIGLQLKHVLTDFVYLRDKVDPEEMLKTLKEYKVLFYPHATILTKERMEILERYVEAGGTLVFGSRTGYKDITCKCTMDYLPGPAAKVTGVDIQEYSFVAPFDGTIRFDWDGEQAEAAVFIDCLTPIGENTKVEATFVNGLYESRPALTCNPYGKGKAYYFGGAFALDTADLFIRKLGLAEPYSDVLEIPESVELVVREKEGKEYLFVLNYPGKQVEINLKQPLKDLLSGEVLNGTVVMKPYEVMVFVLEG